MSDLYKTSRRCYLIDHHSPDPPAVTLEHLGISEYEEFFTTAQIDSVMVYCKDHWGVTYYDSSVPGSRKHPGVKGDWIREVRELTRRKELEFIAYYCIEYDTWAGISHPQWCVKKADGSDLIRDDLYAKWKLCCTQTGYRGYTLAHITEIVQNYRPDALFLDIFGASLCYCEHCRNKFEKLYGYSLPETDDGLFEHRLDITSFLNRNAKEYLEEVITAAKSVDPSVAVTINFSCHYPKEIRDMLDYQFSEPLLGDNWFSAVYARDTARGQFPILTPGEASQVYNYDPEPQYICDLSSIAAQGCRVGMYSGSQHFDGTLEHMEARRLGSAYRELKKLEPYFQNRIPVKSVGILQSDASREVNTFPFHPDAILRMKKHNPHTHAILGAMELCEQEKIPYGILPEGEVTAQSLASYELLLLPEVYVIPDHIGKLLAEYVRQGGKLLISGKSGLWNPDFTPRSEFALCEIMGVNFKKIHTEFARNGWSAYLKADSGASYSESLQATTPPVSDFFLEVSGASAQTKFHFVLPCTKCTDNSWVNWWSPPPGPETAFPALTINACGRGLVCYAAFDLFTMAAEGTYRYLPALFHQICSELALTPPVRNLTDIPNILRTAYFSSGQSCYVHQISTAPHTYKGDAPPISGGILRFAGPIRAARTVYPEEKPLTVEKDGDFWSVALPSFTQQQFIVLDYGE